MNRIWMMAALLGAALAVVGCKKSEAASSDASCKAGAYSHKNPDFCIELPAGYTAKPEEKSGTGTTLRFEGAKALEVRWDPKRDMSSYPAYLKAMGTSNSNGDTGVAQGPLPNGGYFGHVHYKSGIEQVEYMVHGPKGYLVCYSNQFGTDMPPLEQSCKSLRWQ